MTELHSFCFGCLDGSAPVAGLTMDASGNLYGTTEFGGTHGAKGCGVGLQCGGVVFELAPPGAGTASWTETVLYDFCANKGCADGASPRAGLLVDASGNLYGTTAAGGNHLGNGNTGGTIFELMPNAGDARWTEAVLHEFCHKGQCTDGANPQAGLIQDASGNLYGTVPNGGGPGKGAVFELVNE